MRERRELVLPSCAPSEELTPALEQPLVLLSAETDLGFRATVVPIDEAGRPLVTRECRDALGVSSGDLICVTPLP